MAFGWDDALGLALGAISASSKPQAPRTTTDKTPWGPQAEQLQNLFSSAQNLYEAGVPINPAMSGPTQQAQQMLLDTAEGFGGFMSPYQQAQQFALGDVLSPESNPYLKQYMDMVTQNVMKGVTEQALPAIRGTAISTGGYGGSRQGIAEAQAIERGAQQAGAAVSGLASNAYGQGLNTMNAALSRAPQFAALQFLPAEQLAKAGATTEQYQRQQAMDPWQRAQMYQGLIGGQNWGGGMTTTGQALQTNPLLSAAGGYLSGKELFNNVFKPRPDYGVVNQGGVSWSTGPGDE